MNYQDNLPIKPSQPIPNEKTVNDRPLYSSKTAKNFNKKLEDSSSFHTPSSLDNPDEAIENEPKALPSVFDLSKKSKNAKLSKTDTRPTFEPQQVPAKQSNTVMGKPSANPKINQPLSEDNSENIDQWNEGTEITSNTDVTWESEAFGLSSDAEVSSDISLKRRFEIPNQPTYPDDDDMIAMNAQAEQQVANPDFKKVKDFHDNMYLAEMGDSAHLATKDSVASKNKSKSLFNANSDSEFHVEERADLPTPLAAIAPTNPVMLGEQRTSEAASSSNPRSIVMRELVQKIVEGIQTIKQNGVTETIVTLRHPPVLEGTKVTIAAFDTARNEFNIAFSSPTHQAQLILERHLNKDPLMEALENKGFVIHTITTNLATPSTTAFNAEQGQQFQRENQQQGQGSQGQNPERQRQNQEEEEYPT